MEGDGVDVALLVVGVLLSVIVGVVGMALRLVHVENQRQHDEMRGDIKDLRIDMDAGFDRGSERFRGIEADTSEIKTNVAVLLERTRPKTDDE